MKISETTVITKTYHLELSEIEACLITSILYSIGGDPNNSPRKISDAMLKTICNSNKVKWFDTSDLRDQKYFMFKDDTLDIFLQKVEDL